MQAGGLTVFITARCTVSAKCRSMKIRDSRLKFKTRKTNAGTSVALASARYRTPWLHKTDHK